MLTNQFGLYFDSAFSGFCQTSHTSQPFLSMPNIAIAAFQRAYMKEFSSCVGFSQGDFPSWAVPAVLCKAVPGSSGRIYQRCFIEPRIVWAS